MDAVELMIGLCHPNGEVAASHAGGEVWAHEMGFDRSVADSLATVSP